MAAAAIPFDANIIHPDDYVEDYPHEVWTYLREHDPVHWWDRTRGVPFWAITKHADIVEISKQPEVFRSGVRFGVRHRPEYMDPEPLPLTLGQSTRPPREHVLVAARCRVGRRGRTVIQRRNSPSLA